MTQAVLNLLGEHANIVRMLDAFERQLEVFEAAATPDYDVVRGSVDYCVTFLDEYHHPKEDFILDKLRQRDRKTAERVGDLEAEHVDLAVLTRDLLGDIDGIAQGREVPRVALIAKSRDFVAAYRKHIRLEEEVLFPAAENSLTDGDWKGYRARFKRNDPVFGSEAEKRFRALHDDILAWENREA